jgi:serine/threonine protein kinase
MMTKVDYSVVFCLLVFEILAAFCILLTYNCTGTSVDWWALGVITFEFLTGTAPFSDDTPERIFRNILSLDIPWPAVPEDMSQVAKDFISKLLVMYPLEAEILLETSIVFLYPPASRRIQKDNRSLQ